MHAQYVDCPVETLPSELQGSVLFQDVCVHVKSLVASKRVQGANSQGPSISSKAKGKQVDYQRAMQGIGSEGGSAYESRGDGVYAGGNTLNRRGNVMHIAPGALQGENAERTLQQLDELQQAPVRQQPIAQTKRQEHATKYLSVLSAAGNLLDDLEI